MKTLMCVSFSLMLMINFIDSSGGDLKTISCSRDNTICEIADGSLANSRGHIYVGCVNKGLGLSIRRGLIYFDVAGNIPSDALIDSVRLTINVNSAMNSTVELHKVLSDWGEGTSNSSGGNGVAPTNNDVTWLASYYPSAMWVQPGGDYNSTISASTSVSSSATTVIIASDSMKADVEKWLKTPTLNFGWLLKTANETSYGTISKFYSKETGTAASLAIYYKSQLPSNILELKKNTYRFFPNPASDYIYVAFDETVKLLEVFDLMGNLVLQKTADSKINVENLTSGTYILKIETNSGIYSELFIKK